MASRHPSRNQHHLSLNSPRMHPPPQCLTLLLQSRQQWLVQHLQAAANAADPETAARALCQACDTIQHTVAQVGELFLQAPMEPQPPLVAALAAGEGVSSSELLFGPLPTEATDVVCGITMWETACGQWRVGSGMRAAA